MVIGSAEGLGLAFAEHLSAVVNKLILVDHQEEVLAASCQHLQSRSECELVSVVMDVGVPANYRELSELVLEHECRLVIFNAAYAPVKRFEQHTAEELDTYLNLNCGALLHLTHQFTQMEHTGRRGFLAMSSLAGLHGTQYVAAYGASKAFTWNLMESLNAEFKSQKFDFCGVCAGPIDTPGYRRSSPQSTGLTPKPMTPADVAYSSLMALGKTGRHIPGMSNRTSMNLLSRVFTRKMSVRLINRTMEQMFGTNLLTNQNTRSIAQDDELDQKHS